MAVVSVTVFMGSTPGMFVWMGSGSTKRFVERYQVAVTTAPQLGKQ
jgi:low affinity Fe/Cu permease